jgi:hypothetical protein
MSRELPPAPATPRVGWQPMVDHTELTFKEELVTLQRECTLSCLVIDPSAWPSHHPSFFVNPFSLDMRRCP